MLDIEYRKNNRRKKAIIICMIIALFLFIFISLCAGEYEISLQNIIKVLLNRSTNQTDSLVVFRIRLPRIIAAVLAGFGLSIAGCIMQNNLNNSLASPSTLGLSAAATFGANFAIIYLGAGSLSTTFSNDVLIQNPYLVTLGAFIFSMSTVFLILIFSKITNFNPPTVILAGVALSSLFSAGTIILQYFASEDEMTRAVFWSFGDLSRIKWNEILILFIVVLCSFLYFKYKQTDYDTLLAGEDTAKSLGVETDKTRIVGLVLSSLITAVCMSFLGLIAFVGLLGPHISKKLVGVTHKYLLPTSGLIGSLILVIADYISRNAFSPIVLPIGAITSFIGGLMFLYILFRREFVTHD